MNYDDLIRQFARRNITCEVVADRHAALERAKGLIQPGSSVSFCGSKTVHQCGIFQWLRGEGDRYTLYDPYRPGIDWPERLEINKAGMQADWLLTGANAVTMKGELVNLDGMGNRTAGINFGPKRVLVVAGINKLVDSLEAGIRRVREIAAPMNSKRLGRGNPCEKDGKCHDCSLPTRICRVWSIVEGQMDPSRMIVLLVKDELGM